MWWRSPRLGPRPGSRPGSRRAVLAAALCCALLGGSLALVGAPGASGQQTDKQRQLTQEIAETTKATQDARAAAAAFQAEKARLDATLGGLQTQLGAAEASLAAAHAELDRINFMSALLVAQIDKTQRKLEDAMDDAKESAVQLYQRPSHTGVMELIGSTDGAGEFVEAKVYLEHVSQKRRNDLARAERLRKALDGQKAELDDQQRLADEARTQAEAKAQEIETLLAQQQTARDDAARAQAGFEAQAAEYSAKLAAEEADLAAENARVAALIQSLSTDETPSSLGGSGALLRPVGGSISSGFGYRTDPVTGAQAFHAGIDFAVSCGTPIKAAGNGSVIVAGDQGGYGNTVIINHGGGLATLYAHQSSIAAGVGQAVTAGQVIGYVGSTGKSTGCHLHFEVRQNGSPVNPSAYL